MDRPELQNLINQLNEKFLDTQLQMKKNPKTTQEQLNRLSELRSGHELQLRKQFGDDLAQLNLGDKVNISGGTKLGGLSQDKLPDMSKQPLHGKEGMFKRLRESIKGKKGLAGIGAAALGLGLSAAPEDSFASDVGEGINKAGEIVDLASPTTHVMGELADEDKVLSDKERFNQLRSSISKDLPTELDMFKANIGKKQLGEQSETEEERLKNLNIGRFSRSNDKRTME